MLSLIRKLKILKKMTKCYFSYKLGRPKFFHCSLYLTFKCNLTCAYCPIITDTGIKGEAYEYPRSIKSEFNTEQVRYLIDQVNKLGIVVLTFTGGEPFLRSDLEELASYAKTKNMLVLVNTNATLITKERVKALTNSFDTICIPIAGRPETNDQIMGESFKKKEEGIKLLKEHTKSKVNINFVINKLNFKEIDWVLNYARENADAITFLPVEFTPNLLLDEATAREVGGNLMLLKKKYGNFITNTQSQLNLFPDHLAGKKQDIKCDAFDLYLSVGPNGDVFGCCALRLTPIGNLFRESMHKIILKGKKEKELRKIRCLKCFSGPMSVSTIFREPIYKNIALVKNYLGRKKVS